MKHAPTNRGKVIVSGILFWYPLAGVTYQFLHYMIGLRSLGYDVYYVEDSGRWIYDAALNDLSPDATPNIKAVAPTLAQHGFAGKWAFRGNYPEGQCYGLTVAQLEDLYRDADLFINVTGSQELYEQHFNIPLRIYLETDPVASQIKVAQGDRGLISLLESHHLHFSFGENLGRPDCGVPVEKFNWMPTRQPVVLELWENRVVTGDRGRYNTIASWANRGKDLLWKGETYYWSKDREFAKILDLPRRCEAHFEIVARPDEASETLFKAQGWHFREPLDVSRQLPTYLNYIQNARGEFTVAKDQNIRLRSGWFSDRSACYLAAGRPVITQETGFSNIFPVGCGLFGFSTLEDAVTAVEAIESDYPRHCRGAQEIAREYFSAEKVLAYLLQRAGL